MDPAAQPETDLERLSRLLPPRHVRALADLLQAARQERAHGEATFRLRLTGGLVSSGAYVAPELVL